jgi:hypothetical protein
MSQSPARDGTVPHQSRKALSDSSRGLPGVVPITLRKMSAAGTAAGYRVPLWSLLTANRKSATARLCPTRTPIRRTSSWL